MFQNNVRKYFEMDSALDKVELYDFFGVFLSGMLAVVISYYVEIPIITFTENTYNDFIIILIFLLGSYFIGLVLQEASSLLDKKIKYFKFREKARTNFLNTNNSVIKNTLELKDYQVLANEILNKNDDSEIYSNTECEYVYYYCKTYLELHYTNDKVNRIISLYGMSRNLLLALPIITARYIYFNYKSLDMLIVGSLCASAILFYKRCKRFSQYKVRVILRQYKLSNNR